MVMLERIKQGANRVIDQGRKMKIEKEKRRAETLIKQSEEEQKRLQIEKENLQVEKERLLHLTDQELKVEMIFAVRGFYQRLESIDSVQRELIEEIKTLTDKVSCLENDLLILQNRINNENEN